LTLRTHRWTLDEGGQGTWRVARRRAKRGAPNAARRRSGHQPASPGPPRPCASRSTSTT
jgi:hypothetical protein